MSLKNGTFTSLHSPPSSIQPRNQPTNPTQHTTTPLALVQEIQGKYTNQQYTDAFPSSAAFDVINSTLQADPAERKDAIEKAKAVVAFNLKNKDGQEEAWHLDLKDQGVVAKGAAPAGGKADGEFCRPGQPSPG